MLKPSPWLLTLAFAGGLAMPESILAQAAPAPPSAPVAQSTPATDGGAAPAAKHTGHHSSKHRHRRRTHRSSHKARRHHTPAATPAQTQPTQQN